MKPARLHSMLCCLVHKKMHEMSRFREDKVAVFIRSGATRVLRRAQQRCQLPGDLCFAGWNWDIGDAAAH